MIWLIAAVLVGWPAGMAANLAADRLPARRDAAQPEVAASPAAGRSLAHTLTWPWPLSGSDARPPVRALLLVLAMIAAFALIVWQSGGDPLRILPCWLYAWFLLTVLVIDLEHRLVLNVMTGPMAVVALAASLLPGTPTPGEALIGGAGAFAVFFLIALIGRGAMGMGDVKLAGVIGLMVGYPLVLPALAGGIFLGGLAALILLVSRRASRKSAFAYAPYLCLGALVILILMA